MNIRESGLLPEIIVRDCSAIVDPEGNGLPPNGYRIWGQMFVGQEECSTVDRVVAETLYAGVITANGRTVPRSDGKAGKNNPKDDEEPRR